MKTTTDKIEDVNLVGAFSMDEINAAVEKQKAALLSPQIQLKYFGCTWGPPKTEIKIREPLPDDYAEQWGRELAEENGITLDPDFDLDELTN